MIEVGQALPETRFSISTDEGMKTLTTATIFANRRVVLVAVPGAFTPTCSNIHLPGFIKILPALKERGIDDVVCLSVNDPFVMRAWAQSQGVEGKITMLADGNADFTRKIGMDFDGSGAGLGIRSLRYNMVVANGIVKDIYLEPNPGACEMTQAAHLLENI